MRALESKFWGIAKSSGSKAGLRWSVLKIWNKIFWVVCRYRLPKSWPGLYEPLQWVGQGSFCTKSCHRKCYCEGSSLYSIHADATKLNYNEYGVCNGVYTACGQVIVSRNTILDTRAGTTQRLFDSGHINLNFHVEDRILSAGVVSGNLKLAKSRSSAPFRYLLTALGLFRVKFSLEPKTTY